MVRAPREVGDLNGGGGGALQISNKYQNNI